MAAAAAAAADRCFGSVRFGLASMLSSILAKNIGIICYPKAISRWNFAEALNYSSVLGLLGHFRAGAELRLLLDSPGSGLARKLGSKVFL